MQTMVTKTPSGIFTMKYTYRIEHIELLGKKSFIESSQWHDLLAVGEEWLRDFDTLFILSTEEKESYLRIKKWIEENHPEFMM